MGGGNPTLSHRAMHRMTWNKAVNIPTDTGKIKNLSPCGIYERVKNPLHVSTQAYRSLREKTHLKIARILLLRAS